VVAGTSDLKRFLALAHTHSHPVAAGAAGTGDLGWTVGEATIAATGAEPTHSKYLTAWMRLDGGSIRFVSPPLPAALYRLTGVVPGGILSVASTSQRDGATRASIPSRPWP
jgi:hypothetical protein